MWEEKDDSYSHILKYTGIFGGVQGLNIFIGLVRNKVVASLLGPAGMGLVSLFNTVVNFVSQATNFGISFSAVRHMSEIFEEGDAGRISHFVGVVRLCSLLTALLGMAVCVCLGPVLSSYTFSWGDHTLHFMLLFPAVGLMALTGGETAILKGARKLRALAVIQVWTMLSALVIAIPLYYYFGQTGIVPCIVLTGLASMLITVAFSLRLYPLRLPALRPAFAEGVPMVQLGLGFIVAGLMGSGAEMFIRSYLNVVGELETVGFYNTAYMLTMTYGGMVFSAMETDYFPRLSAVNKDVAQCNLKVNRQIEVSLLIIAPMLVAFLFCAPIVIPVLFTAEFMPVVGVMRIMTLALYLRAITLPVAYLTLAKGDSLPYMLLEGIYDTVIVLFIVAGYSTWGLEGTGIAVLAASALDLVLVCGYAYMRYGFRFSATLGRYALPLMALGVVAFVLTFTLHGWQYWASAMVLCAASLAFSLTVLHRKTSLWNKLKQRFLKKS